MSGQISYSAPPPPPPTATTVTHTNTHIQILKGRLYAKISLHTPILQTPEKRYSQQNNSEEMGSMSEAALRMAEENVNTNKRLVIGLREGQRVGRIENRCDLGLCVPVGCFYYSGISQAQVSED